MHTPKNGTVQIALSISMIVWGISFVAVRSVLDAFEPMTYMTLRFAMGSLVFLVLVPFFGVPRLPLRVVAITAGLAAAEPFGYFLFETYSLGYIGATGTSLVIALIPMAVTIMSAIFLKEPITPRGVAALLLSIVGIALLIFTAPPGNGSNGSAGALEGLAAVPRGERAIGIGLALGAVLAAATYITLARSLTQRYNSHHITMFQTWWGAVYFAVIWAVRGEFDLAPILVVDVGAWGALAFLVIGSTIAVYLLYNWALRWESAETASLYINAIPIVTAITAWVILDERLGMLQIVGGILVIAAVRISTARALRPYKNVISP